MKKTVFILTIFLAGFVFNSCEDQLNQAPISNPSAASFFKTSTDFQQAVNGVYNALGANPQTGMGYAIRRFELSEIRSDNIYSPGTGVRDWNPINNFEKTLATNPYMAEAWNSNFIGIVRANLVLDNLKTTNIELTDAMRNQLTGESKFLRAFFYFDLVRWFGKVPVIDRAVTPEESLSISRSPVSTVYDLIIADLTDAISKLPTTYAVTADRGRATSLVAKSLLGLVYLTRTGPTYGIEGPGMATNEFAQAVAMFNDVINSGRFSFVSGAGSYAGIFSYTNEANQDIVFDIQAIGGSTGDLGLGARFPTEMYDELYAAVAPALGFAGGVPSDSPKAPSNDLKASFETGDVRRTVSILPSYVSVAGATISTGQFVKFLDKARKGVDRFNWPINYPVMRFTDVLMMKAEAILRGGGGSLGTQAEVDAIVNQVRTRAGLPSVSNVTLDMLLKERRNEFVAEGLRWHDLVRNGKVLTVMNAWTNVDDPGNKIKDITANDIIYPLPLSQMIVSPGLYEQNPGY